jgi:murein DD-endopeptidase MepM/ murein hydrolase activator NlpD
MRVAVLGFLLPFLVQTGTSRIQITDRRARAFEPGEAMLLTISAPPDANDIRVTAFERTFGAFKAADGVWQALVGIDLEQRSGTYVVTAGDAHLTITIRPKRFPRRTLQVAPEFVTPPPEVQERIAGEAEFLRDLWMHSAGDRLWHGPFVAPVPNPANSSFGSRSVFNDQPRNPHTGTDFSSPEGTPVHAPNAGRVVAARDLFFTGNTVVIDHGLNTFSTLAHLSQMDVHEGETIDAGRIVGLSGATGRVTGPHLHWALRIAGARVDPLSLLAVLGSRAGGI